MNARISFISFLLALISITLYFFINDTAFENEILKNISIGAFLLFAFASVVTAILSLVRKEGYKVLPTISLTTPSISLYFMMIVLVSEDHKQIIVESGSITNFGIFDIPSRKIDSIKVKDLYEYRYLKQNTDSIPATLGLRFGFNYAISGKPEFSYVDISKIIRYPEPGLKRNGKYIHSDSTTTSVQLDKLSYYGFNFEKEYELVAGKWEFEFSYKGTKLFSKVFYVYYPTRHL